MHENACYAKHECRLKEVPGSEEETRTSFKNAILVFLLRDVRPKANNQRGRETPFEDAVIWKCGDRPEASN